MADHATLLLQHGICYPTAERNHSALAAEKAPKRGRAKAALSARKRQLGEAEADLDEIGKGFRADFEREIAGSSAHTLLVSSEYFSTLEVEDLQSLGAYLRQFADELTVVCYVPHPYSDYMARLQRRTRRGHARLRDFPHDRVPSVLPERLDRLVEAFGRDNVVLRPFEREKLHNKDAVADLLKVAGAPDALIERIDAPALNVSPSHEAMVIADALMGLGVGGIGKTEQSHTRPLTTLLYERVRGSRLGFDDASAAALLADSRSQAERIRRDHGLDLSEPTLTPAGERWSDETLADLAEVILELASRGRRATKRGKAERKEPVQKRAGKRRRRKSQPE